MEFRSDWVGGFASVFFILHLSGHVRTQNGGWDSAQTGVGGSPSLLFIRQNVQARTYLKEDGIPLRLGRRIPLRTFSVFVWALLAQTVSVLHSDSGGGLITLTCIGYCVRALLAQPVRTLYSGLAEGPPHIPRICVLAHRASTFASLPGTADQFYSCARRHLGQHKLQELLSRLACTIKRPIGAPWLELASAQCARIGFMINCLET